MTEDEMRRAYRCDRSLGRESFELADYRRRAKVFELLTWLPVAVIVAGGLFYVGMCLGAYVSLGVDWISNGGPWQ